VTRAKSAFTLIELMLVAAVLGIVAAIAAPRVSVLMPRVGLQAAARQVADDVRAAQGWAVDRDRRVGLVYDLDEGTVSIEGAGAPALDALPRGVAIAQVAGATSGAVRIVVFPSGYVAAHRVELESGGGGRMEVEFSGVEARVR
jgi:prepilin-type N-terminal cleavage/methylation domain-containing protein